MKLFTSRELIIYGVSVGIVAVAAVIITIIVGLSSNSSPKMSQMLSEGKDGAIQYSEGIERSQFLLENQMENVYSVEYIPFRKQHSIWTKQQVSQHWIDTKEVGERLLQEKNKELIRELLSEVP